MTADLNAATDTENGAIESFNGLVAAKTKEINAATAAIEAKSIRLGEVSVSIAEMKNDLGDTVDSLADDKKFLADLDKNCASAQEKYDEVVKTRNEELLALADTIKLLNDDDALELFKKTLPAPSASLLQVQVNGADVRARALSLLQRARGAAPRQARLDFLVLALRGKKVGFEKVISMIDGMVSALKKEQVTDSDKKEYRLSTFDTTEDKKKELEHAASDTETAIASAEESIAALAEEIAEAEKSIKALDASVSEATAIRKAENG